MADSTVRRVPVGIGVILSRFAAGGATGGREEILVGLRAGSHGAGQWALPGGWLERFESFEDCAARELAEETGVGRGDLLDLRPSARVPPSNNLLRADDVHSVTVFVEARLRDPGAPVSRLEPHKCLEWRWAPWSELPSPLFPGLEHARAAVLASSGAKTGPHESASAVCGHADA